MVLKVALLLTTERSSSISIILTHNNTRSFPVPLSLHGHSIGIILCQINGEIIWRERGIYPHNEIHTPYHTNNIIIVLILETQYKNPGAIRKRRGSEEQSTHSHKTTLRRQCCPLNTSNLSLLSGTTELQKLDIADGMVQYRYSPINN